MSWLSQASRVGLSSLYGARREEIGWEGHVVGDRKTFTDFLAPIRERLLRYFRETEGFLDCIYQNMTGVVLVDVSGVLKDDVDKIIVMSQQCCCQKILDGYGPLVFGVSGEQCLDKIVHLICMGAD